MYTSILCFMVVSLRKLQFMIAAELLVRISGNIVYDNLDKCFLLPHNNNSELEQFIRITIQQM